LPKTSLENAKRHGKNQVTRFIWLNLAKTNKAGTQTFYIPPSSQSYNMASRGSGPVSSGGVTVSAEMKRILAQPGMLKSDEGGQKLRELYQDGTPFSFIFL
jgi:hypothetical protein